ncbi:hypothetical protein MLD38_039502 [Melastoma candidum]|uniref:Uncharacterized protein n=1 Tax=Melastoma candidum TaxID=119954 RepID=A0ACB9L308_9MYRT|nr:hypothetical protein MLD38_039502 [Melastoma candidum]
MSSNSRSEPFKVFGQRSIIPSLSVSKIGSRGTEDGTGACRVSLSEFLDRKVGRASGDSPFAGKGEAKEFLTPLRRRDGKGVCDSGMGRMARQGDGGCCVRDEVIFKQFKLSGKDKEHVVCIAEADLRAGRELPSEDEEAKGSRKRRDPFRGENCIPPKHVIILGYGPETKQEESDIIHFRNQKRRHLYDHYANGGGFWDGDMEGIDSEEVGCKETWEGIGSTTLGELDWN